MSIKISCVILTKNSQKTIESAIKSASFCYEVIVVDDYSSDNTLKIAKRMKTRVFSRKVENNFSSQRNFAMSKAKNNWVLFLDSDEEVSKKLYEEISELKLDGKIKAYRIRRQNFYFNKRMKHGEWGDIKLIRLGDRRGGKFVRSVHEYWKINGAVGELKGSIYHFQDNNLNNFLEKVNRYSTLHSNELYKEKKSSSFFKIVFWPFIKLINNLFIKKGILDGTYGFVIATMMSFHSFLAWSKLWQNNQK